MMLIVPRALLARLVCEAESAAPDECCGLLLGEDGRIQEVRPARNVAADPLTRFEIDPTALLAAHKAARAGGVPVIGYYHSHPCGDPVPSATDIAHSTGDLRIWAIIARGQVAFWRDTGDGFAPVDCRACDDAANA